MPKEEMAAGWKLVMVLPRRRQRSRRRVWASSWTWSGAFEDWRMHPRPVPARPPRPACPRPARLWQVSPLSPWLASLRPPRHLAGIPISVAGVCLPAEVCEGRGQQDQVVRSHQRRDQAATARCHFDR
ncbi:hypothetical protein VPH35_135384 [Triticum aestivum]